MGRRAQPKPWDTRENLYDLYVVQELSFGQIAKMYGTYSNTIRRAVKRHGIEPRDKSEAQKNFLDKNDHPMLGRERTEQERMNISKGIQEHWEGLSEEEDQARREEMAERAKLRWEWMDDEERASTIKKLHQANREKAGLGSKNENAIANFMRESGYTVYQRTTEYSPRRAFEIDIAIPSERIAIEWDGAAHYEPIYGDDALKKTIEKDKRKNAALISHGWKIIRCRDHSTAHSIAFCQRALKLILDAMSNINEGEVVYIDAF